MGIQKLLGGAAAITLLAACSPGDDAGQQTSAPAAGDPAADVTQEVAQVSESERLNVWFQEQFDAGLERSPMTKAFLGIIDDDYGSWNNLSPEFAEESYQLGREATAEMQASFDYDALDEQAQLSYRLYEYNDLRSEQSYPFRDYGYIFNQMFGPQSGIPAFLINQHRVADLSHAEAYIARLEGVEDYLGQAVANAARRFDNGIYPPKFVYDHVLRDSRNVITGAPFDGGEDSAIWADFKAKISNLELEEDATNDLLARGEAAMLGSVGPAYEGLIAEMERQVVSASEDDGAWKLPNGGAYYADNLIAMTTTSMTPDEIHQVGLDETARIHDEMREIMTTVGYEGSLQEFFEFMRSDPQFYYANDEEGRQRYLDEATAMIETMKGRLDELFITKPQADMIVKRVEAFRERSAGKAFYQSPAADGSRPGTYYANLYDMNAMPTYQMEALAYHEGIPGHHMQRAISQELEGIPNFRKFGGYTAYTEGWGLYSEWVPKEMGFYEDPYSDFGRLAMELWRAGRLVVDTGLHEKRWTREQAIDWLMTNTPNPESDAVKAIERYIVMPGQATAYKIGMLKIQELRTRAEDALGDDFDVREYHDLVLANGAVPLAVLEDNVDAWIIERLAS